MQAKQKFKVTVTDHEVGGVYEIDDEWISSLYQAEDLKFDLKMCHREILNIHKELDKAQKALEFKRERLKIYDEFHNDLLRKYRDAEVRLLKLNTREKNESI